LVSKPIQYERLRSEVVWEPEVGELMAQAADEIEQLRAERQELWRTVSDIKAAVETAGFIFRNTDSGPALVLPDPPERRQHGVIEDLEDEIARLRLTQEEREAVESSIWDYEQNADDEDCARLVATLRGLLERTADRTSARSADCD